MKNKLNKPIFWLIIAGIYFLVLLSVVWVYNPDFLQWENMLLFVPLYLPLLAASHLKHIKDEDDSYNRWEVILTLAAVTAIVVVFKVILRLFE